MSLKSDDNQAAIKPIDLVFILAIAGRIDAQSRLLAQQLDNSGLVYYGYAALDSLSSSYSMFKYFFDLCISSNDPDLMHEVMMTPSGIIAMVVESLFLVAFSVLAVKFDSEKEDSYKKCIASAWPYFRDVMKGLKNAYKGWRSAVVAINLIGGVDIKSLIAPVGLLLGICAAANRFWLRGMVEDRKVMMTSNTRLRNQIKKLRSLTPEDKKYYLKEIEYQTNKTRVHAFASVALGGFIDGLYLYVGVLSLAALSFPMFSALAAVCAVYTVACVITRIYEEYDFQMRLIITQTKCRFELIAKDLELTYATLLTLQGKTHKNKEDLLELSRLKNALSSVLEDFDVHRKLLTQQSNYTYTTAALLGLKNGLYAYGALASILFLAGSILTISGVVFPPSLLIVAVLSGLVFIVGFIINSLVVNYNHLNKKQSSVERPYSQLMDMKNKIKDTLDAEEMIEAESFRKSVNDGLFVDASPQFFFQEWFEVIRSLFSGLGKGQKFVDFAGNSLQEADNQGHYHDTKIMYILGLFSAVLFGITLALRALARGFGRAPLGQDQTPIPVIPKPTDPKPEIPNATTNSEEPGDINDNSLQVTSQTQSPKLTSYQEITDSAVQTQSPKLTSYQENTDSAVQTQSPKLTSYQEITDSAVQTQSPKLTSSQEITDSVVQTQLPEETSQTTKLSAVIPIRSKSYVSLIGFFNRKDPKPTRKKTMPRSESDASLVSRDPLSDNTIQGLS